MSWIGLLLIGLAFADLAHTARPVRRLPELAAAALVVVLGLLAGFTDGWDLVAVLVIAAVTVAWGWAVTYGFGARRPWIPLAVASGALAVAIGTSGAAPTADGALGDWLDSIAVPFLSDLSPDRFLVLLGVVALQLSSGNVIVRLVLGTTGTLNPARDTSAGPENKLKGGRLLGPMERLLILGLGLAGELAAAGLVVAAKGLLRFPELSSHREQERIHRLTEYFLVGSFASWLIPLGGVLLLA